MARKSGAGVNKSEEVRQLLKANPNITAKEVADTLAAKGIKVAPNLFYFVKGHMKGRKARKNRAMKAATGVARGNSTGGNDAVATIRKVKALAGELGGMRNLKAIVDVLSE